MELAPSLKKLYLYGEQTSCIGWYGISLDIYMVGPISTITACPTVVDWENEAEAQAAQECMKRGRSVENIESFIDFSSHFDEKVIFIGRPSDEGGDTNPLRVTLWKKKKSGTQNKSKFPLILYIHGGGFITRLSKKYTSARIFAELLKLDVESSSVMESATFAIVDYRLAPEYIYTLQPQMIAFWHRIISFNTWDLVKEVYMFRVHPLELHRQWK